VQECEDPEATPKVQECEAHELQIMECEWNCST
jgi:hypothetical protein